MEKQNSILLVDDQEEDIRLALRVLNKIKLVQKVLIARDGPEALDLLRQPGAKQDDFPGLPNLILLDVKLPRMDGIEVLKQIRADPATRRIPVIILTTSSEEEDIRRSYDNHVNSYVRKPVDYDEFSTMMQQLIEYWFTINIGPK